MSAIIYPPDKPGMIPRVTTVDPPDGKWSADAVRVILLAEYNVIPVYRLQVGRYRFCVKQTAIGDEINWLASFMTNWRFSLQGIVLVISPAEHLEGYDQ